MFLLIWNIKVQQKSGHLEGGKYFSQSAFFLLFFDSKTVNKQQLFFVPLVCKSNVKMSRQIE